MMRTVPDDFMVIYGAAATLSANYLCRSQVEHGCYSVFACPFAPLGASAISRKLSAYFVMPAQARTPDKSQQVRWRVTWNGLDAPRLLFALKVDVDPAFAGMT